MQQSIIAARGGPGSHARYSFEVIVPVEGLKKRRNEKAREHRWRINSTPRPAVIDALAVAMRRGPVSVAVRASRCRVKKLPGRKVRRFATRRVGWWAAVCSLAVELPPGATWSDRFRWQRRLAAHAERAREHFAAELLDEVINDADVRM